jgi:hypothetical protein
VILLVLVVVLWIVVLAPSAYRRISERGGVESIEHFHHHLNRLEHAGPKLVTPAYRLHTAVPGGIAPVPAEPASSMYRAKLVLLRPVDDEESSDIDGMDGAHYERVGVLNSPEPEFSYDLTRAELRAHRHQEARRRCSSMLLALTGVTISTALLGILPALRMAWIITGLTGALLLAMVGLIAYAREFQSQPERWATTASPSWGDGGTYADDDESGWSYRAASEAGYPGAWDEEDDYPRHAATCG